MISGGNNCQITVDTGSSISLVRPDVLKTEPECSEMPLKDGRLRTVTGDTTPLLSRAGLTLQLGSLTTNHDFYSADIVDDCILGMDYLRPAGAVLDLGKGTLTIGSEKIPLLESKKNAESVCCRAVAATTTTVPPKSETVVPVQLVHQKRVWKPGWGLLQSDDSHPQNGLLVGRTLVDLNQEVLPVWVMNVTTGT